MRTDLVVMPDAETLKQRAYDLWAWQANRRASTVLAALEDMYKDLDVALPTLNTLYHWISREKWHDRADQELADDYTMQVRRWKMNYWQNVQLAQQRINEALLGIRDIPKDLAPIIMHLDKTWGIGTQGANQGGEMTLEFTMDRAEAEVLSLEQRARKMRALMAEQSRDIS